MTREEAWKLAEHWVAAWNAHDLEQIMAHYDDAVELTSPVAAQLLGIADGKVVGKANVRASRECAVGTQQRGVVLHEPEGDAYGGVYGAIREQESAESCGAL